MTRGRGFALALVLVGAVGGGRTAEPMPVLMRSGAGRFEVAAVDATQANGAIEAAEGIWRHLERPLSLPAAFSSPVFVRIIPPDTVAPGREAFRVNVEPGGVVSVWLRTGAEHMLRHALVRGLLHRLAVAWHGGAGELTVPLWLEHACVGWWITRAEPAQWDALKQRAARMSPPPIAALLDWKEGTAHPPEFAEAAVWLIAFLQAESGREGEWTQFLRRLFAGGDPQAMLAACYPGRFAGVQARELWWQTGWHHARRGRSLPVMEAAESRLQLGALARFVCALPSGDADRLVPLEEVMARRDEPMVQAEIARRSAELAQLVPALHPFYRNAGLSLAEIFNAGTDDKEQRSARSTAFAQDWRDGSELEFKATEVLDALERQAVRRSPP